MTLKLKKKIVELFFNLFCYNLITGGALLRHLMPTTRLVVAQTILQRTSTTHDRLAAHSNAGALRNVEKVVKLRRKSSNYVEIAKESLILYSKTSKVVRKTSILIQKSLRSLFCFETISLVLSLFSQVLISSCWF